MKQHHNFTRAVQFSFSISILQFHNSAHSSSNMYEGHSVNVSLSLSATDKPSILLPSSTCVMEELDVLCHCSVDSNPRAAITWSVNGTVPPHNFNLSVLLEPKVLTATLRGRMDKPQTVICFALNALGNDSLLLLQASTGVLNALHNMLHAHSLMRVKP